MKIIHIHENRLLSAPGGAAAQPPDNTLSFQSAGTYQSEINSAPSASAAPGSGADLINVDNRLTITAGTTANSRFTVAIVSLDANNAAFPLSDFDPSKSYRFTLLTSAGISGFAAGEFTVDTSEFGNGLAGGSFVVMQDGNNLELVYSAVPEPSTWTLLGLGGMGLAGLAVRRRRVGSI